MKKIINTVSELAQLYNPAVSPRSAQQMLKRWIKNDLELTARLEALGFKPRQQLLTPLQYAAIIAAFGEP